MTPACGRDRLGKRRFHLPDSVGRCADHLGSGERLYMPLPLFVAGLLEAASVGQEHVLGVQILRSWIVARRLVALPLCAAPSAFTLGAPPGDL